MSKNFQDKDIAFSVPLTKIQEFKIKKTAISRSAECFLLADQSKFDHVSLMTFCEINDLNCVITDAKPSDEYIEYFNDNNVDLKICEKVIY